MIPPSSKTPQAAVASASGAVGVGLWIFAWVWHKALKRDLGSRNKNSRPKAAVLTNSGKA
jgi:hypothetical protein